ncbi:sensor histidine kinase [Kutzneria sp. CA-103260]|uniref:sensor histidine kinase n=1 Tax=Kutzneria sp. CA-103260 TaxID=2802641 RepID=UPI001BAC072A|nr:HAMP domain-containing sensor histidine kinase [Kutzneria sp. CA-103260]QUQ63726.1 Sensor protein CzcS [Kutzneria sp. CA-103260]
MGTVAVPAVMTIAVDIRLLFPGPPYITAWPGHALSIFPVVELCRTPVFDYPCFGGGRPSSQLGSLLAALLVLAAAVLIGWVAIRWALRPLGLVSTVVDELGPGNLGRRVRLSGRPGDPLKQLADSVDGALDRLAAGYEGQRSFASNASHELRTPLAVQRMLVELALDDEDSTPDLNRLGSLLLRANERSERMIEGLLTLAESERGLTAREPVNLADITREVLALHADTAAARSITITAELAETVVLGDSVLLERMIGNLVHNAVKYNLPNGWVRVELADRPSITVANGGEVIPAAVAPTLFEPFRRMAGERSAKQGGSGLGLSIVRAIATAHGGTATARANPDGGLTVEVDIP